MPQVSAPLGVFGGEAFQLALGDDVAFDQVDAVVVVNGNVRDGDTAVDALGPERALAGRDAVPPEFDDAAGGSHDRCSRSSVGGVGPAGSAAVTADAVGADGGGVVGTLLEHPLHLAALPARLAGA